MLFMVLFLSGNKNGDGNGNVFGRGNGVFFGGYWGFFEFILVILFVVNEVVGK